MLQEGDIRTIYAHPCAACGKHAFKFHVGLHKCGEYQWVCDTCGVQMKIDFSDDGKKACQAPTGGRYDRTLVLLRVKEAPNLAVIIQGSWSPGDTGPRSHYYEEGTCPSNLLRCREVVFNGEADPHGLFEVVEEIVITGPEAVSEEEAKTRLVARAVRETTNQQEV